MCCCCVVDISLVKVAATVNDNKCTCLAAVIC